MSRIYIAGPLFTVGEKWFNSKLEESLKEKLGDQVPIFLPQRECETLGKKFAETRKYEDALKIFEKCKEGVESASLVIAVLDGADADSGSCWELGFANCLGIPVIGLRTDVRGGNEFNGLNIILACSCLEIVNHPGNDYFERLWQTMINTPEIVEKLRKLGWRK